MAHRRFPVSWLVEEKRESFVVMDAGGFPLAYVYFEDNDQRASVTGRMTRDEARRIAANMARLPDLLGAPVTPRP